MGKTKIKSPISYTLDRQGKFVIDNYNQAKSFSSFFPGIAGIWGTPMWVFYVNRGQCIASFGVESKDKALMEFQPANKAYRLTSLQGFRTFIKVHMGSKVIYWEPFQTHLKGTDFKKNQRMVITAEDLTLEEVNEDLGLSVEVNYFTLPEEPYAALIRRVTIKNLKKKNVSFEIIDGMPVMVPYGFTDGLLKNLSRTIEAWVNVRNCENRAPYYQLKVEVADTSQVKHIKEGNFFFSFNPSSTGDRLLTTIIDPAVIFGEISDFTAPENFLKADFKLPPTQSAQNRTPSAFSYSQATIKSHEKYELVSLFGYALSIEQLNTIVAEVSRGKFVAQKEQRNRELIREIRNFAFTNSSSESFNLYAGYTFLDNILRGGLPISVKAKEGVASLNVFSRKHGDLERDYNYFLLSPTFYSQGNGNYRDVNQNRRNDAFFNADVKDGHITSFLNLIQADGYNPLIVQGMAFNTGATKELESILRENVDEKSREQLKGFFKKSFLPGELLKFIQQNQLKIKTSLKDFLGQILGVSQKQEMASHGEGFWSDHWTYNLDLLESYLALYPEDLRGLLIERETFTFYHNAHYVLPRDQRYVLTEKGVRQYISVCDGSAQININKASPVLKSKKGEGTVYQTTLLCKLLCVVANKAASLDPSGIGIEMEADKPNWYDALNGLPGLLGSSLSETLELKRLCLFLIESFKKLNVEDNSTIMVFEELATFISGLSNILSLEADPSACWMKANDIKEHYRQRIRQGVEGEEKQISISEIKSFLESVINKTNGAISKARNPQGFLVTYFYHSVKKFQVIDKPSSEPKPYVRPKEFERVNLPLFLEGYVHALRVASSPEEAQSYYREVRKSPLYDQKLKMYKVNADLANESEEIGRCHIFPPGWLENESIWLHMEYKFLLELLRSGLYEDFFENFKNVLIPFQNTERYGRSILENSSFIVSSAHSDESLHGRGFVARLSGSTAEFLHIWLLMSIGQNPFTLSAQGELILNFRPTLPGWLFTQKETTIDFLNQAGRWGKITLPSKTYAFNFLGKTLVVYHNPKGKDIFGQAKPVIKEVSITYPNLKRPVIIPGSSITPPYSTDIRDRKVERIDVYFS